MGKSGSGKTITQILLEKNYNYKPKTKYSSRPMREGEIQDVTYHFISGKNFEQKIEDGFFIESEKHMTNEGAWYYGVAYEDCTNLNNGDENVIILTPNGVRDLQKLGIDMVVIYLYANIPTINTRLTIRGDDSKEKERRIEADIKDFKDADTLADRIVYNNLSDDIESVVENVDYWYKKILKEKSNEK
jgi:guanylate kinase|nr:MAG TPA: Guanylate kinase [Caudoviricetes sp.]